MNILGEVRSEVILRMLDSRMSSVRLQLSHRPLERGSVYERERNVESYSLTGEQLTGIV